MATNNPINHPHPDDLLEAYALDTLDPDEELQVQEHLTGCLQCNQTVEEFQQAASLLVQTVSVQEPPPELRARLMGALERSQYPQEIRAARPAARSFADWLSEIGPLRLLAPAASVAAVVLVVVAVTMSMRVSDRVNDLERENNDLEGQLTRNNATMTAQLALATDSENRVMNSIRQIQQTNYVLAEDDNKSHELHSPSGSGSSQGVLLVSSDGSRGVIMVAGMDPPAQAASYQVWLMRRGERIWAGTLDVDAHGWGTVTLQSSEPISRFEKVELTYSNGASAANPDMVLEGSLVSTRPPELLVFNTWKSP